MGNQTRFPIDPERPGPPRPPPRTRPRNYKTPKEIARFLKVAHKEGLLLDIPIPEVPADDG